MLAVKSQPATPRSQAVAPNVPLFAERVELHEVDPPNSTEADYRTVVNTVLSALSSAEQALIFDHLEPERQGVMYQLLHRQQLSLSISQKLHLKNSIAASVTHGTHVAQRAHVLLSAKDPHAATLMYNDHNVREFIFRKIVARMNAPAGKAMPVTLARFLDRALGDANTAASGTKLQPAEAAARTRRYDDALRALAYYMPMNGQLGADEFEHLLITATASLKHASDATQHKFFDIFSADHAATASSKALQRFANEIPHISPLTVADPTNRFLARTTIQRQLAQTRIFLDAPRADKASFDACVNAFVTILSGGSERTKKSLSIPHGELDAIVRSLYSHEHADTATRRALEVLPRALPHQFQSKIQETVRTLAEQSRSPAANRVVAVQA